MRKLVERVEPALDKQDAHFGQEEAIVGLHRGGTGQGRGIVRAMLRQPVSNAADGLIRSLP